MKLQHLKNKPIWVFWKYEQTEGEEKPRKTPKNPHTGQNAMSNKATTWGNYEQAMKANTRYCGNGVGLVFTKELKISGVDIDNCFTDGRISEFASFVLGLFPGAYRELSPSGKGIHLLLLGNVEKAVKRGEVEIYDNGRFFTFTGKTPKNALCEEILPGGDNLQALATIAAYKPASEPTGAQLPALPTVGPGDKRKAWVNSLLARKCHELSQATSGRNALICSVVHTMAGYSHMIGQDEVHTAVRGAIATNGYLSHIGEKEFNRVFSVQWKAGQGKPLNLPTLSPDSRYSVGQAVTAKTKHSQIRGIIGAVKWSVEGYLYKLGGAWVHENLIF